jgi:branched-chain amino acid transport system ATP-binding protein
MFVLRTRRLAREFRGFHAVDGVDLEVAEGAVHALVGPNGAGKTTLFNLLSGFLAPTSGSFEVAGHDATGLPPERIARLGVARSFQITTLFPQLCVREHLELALQSRSGLGWRFWRSQKLMGAYTGRAMELLAEVDLASLSESPRSGAAPPTPAASWPSTLDCRSRSPSCSERSPPRCSRYRSRSWRYAVRASTSPW